jgi:hypothetical protein
MLVGIQTDGGYMGKFLKRTALAGAVALAFSGSVFAQATLSNGSITAKLDASGNFDSTTGGMPGLSYLGTEYINWGSFSSWYWLTTASPAGSFLAQFGANPLGAITAPDVPPGTAATTYSFGGLNVRMDHALTQANQMTTTVTLTNPVGGTGAISGVYWNVGLDPDQDIPGLGTYATTNKITGVGGSAAVTAFSAATPITLANTTGVGAYTVAAFINTASCCSAVTGATAIAGGQALGFTHYGDDSISLGYSLGTIGDGASVSFGYSYTFATPVPEPETYAMLLAGLGLMGFVARRRQRKLATA